MSLAWALYRSPARLQGMFQEGERLPDGIGTLLRVAAGDSSQMDELRAATGARASELREAALFFVKQVCFTGHANHYRVLGLNPAATIDQIKEHHRLLMRLFHPDLEGKTESWDDVYATRINQSYNVLRKAGSRQEYDTTLRVQASRQQSHAAATIHQRRKFSAQSVDAQTSSFSLPPVVLRNMPAFVLGGAALIAFAVVYGMYVNGRENSASWGLASHSQEETISPGPEAAADHLKLNISAGEEVSTKPEPLQSKTPAAVHVAANAVVQKSEPKTAQKPKPVPKVESKAEPKPLPNPEQKAIPRNSKAVVPKPSSQPVLVEVAVQKVQLPAQASMPRAPDVPQKAPIQKRPVIEAPVVGRMLSPVEEVKVARVAPAVVVNTSYVASPTKLEVAKPPIAVVEAPTSSFVKPAPTPGALSPVTPPVTIADLEIEMVLARFIGSYDQGDVGGFMSLCDEQIRTNDNQGKSAVRKDYENLFNTTENRRMRLKDLNWMRDGNIAKGEGTFSVQIQGRGGQFSGHHSGKIRFELVKRDKGLLIKGLFHELDVAK